MNNKENNNNNLKNLILGAGCFWGVEYIFENVNGVKDVVSGYSGGDIQNPSYEDVLKGDTNHAEVVKITYDSNIVTLKELLSIFFRMHNPTSLNYQGPDIGTQYRSIVFFQNEEEKNIINNIIKDLNEKYFKGKIVTNVVKLDNFYKAEDYHQDYYSKKHIKPYCHIIRDTYDL